MRNRIESMAFGMIGALIMALVMGPFLKPVEATYTPMTSGMIAYFATANCPAGWSEYTTARGLYVVGRVLGGTLATPVGTLLTNLENRATGIHNHTATFAADPHKHTLETVNAGTPATYSGLAAGSIVTGPTVTGISMATGVPPNIYEEFYSSTGTTTSGSTVTVANSAGVAGTNAPYIQLLTCQKT